jgi:hypothetical protein
MCYHSFRVSLSRKWQGFLISEGVSQPKSIGGRMAAGGWETPSGGINWTVACFLVSLVLHLIPSVMAVRYKYLDPRWSLDKYLDDGL